MASARSQAVPMALVSVKVRPRRSSKRELPKERVRARTKPSKPSIPPTQAYGFCFAIAPRRTSTKADPIAEFAGHPLSEE